MKVHLSLWTIRQYPKRHFRYLSDLGYTFLSLSILYLIRYASIILIVGLHLLVQQPFVQQGAIQPFTGIPQLAVQQPVMQPAVQPVVQQQPVLQSLVQQPIQQPVMQQSAVQPIVQQYVQQPVQQPVVQQVMQPVTVVQQPLVQPVVQQQVQQEPVVIQGILSEQNNVMPQGSYQGILQVCNQGIPDVPSEGTLQCPYQVTPQGQNQGLQLGSQDSEMQPVDNQDYLGMALKALKQGNHQPPQSQQENPGVQQEVHTGSSLCEPSADHSNNQLDECKQADNLCGQHGTAVGSHEKTEVQDQFDQHDKPLLIEVTSTETVQTLLPESASAMLLMTDVPEQTWQPLMPSSASQSYGNQSLPTESIKFLPQGDDCHASQGEVISGDHHIESDEVSTQLNNSTTLHEEPPSIVNVVSCNGTSQYVDDLDAHSTKCMGDHLGNQHETDKYMTSDDHYIYQNDATFPNSSVVVTTADMNRMQQILQMTDNFMPSPFTCLSSPIWKNDDMDRLEQKWKLGLLQPISQQIHFTSTCQSMQSVNTHQRRKARFGVIVREYDQWDTQQRDMVTVTKFRPPDFRPIPVFCWKNQAGAGVMVYHGHVSIIHKECARNVSCGKQNLSHRTCVFLSLTDRRQKKNAG